MSNLAALVNEVSRIVTDITGIQLGEKQSSMVESRLTRRMIQLGIHSPEEYLQHLSDNKDVEIGALVSLLTTHHTTFFREYTHFEYLDQKGLPELLKSMRARGQKVLRVWSAACSRGHEVYSLAMFLGQHLKKNAPDITFEILGSDVDQQSVEVAKNGVYRWDEIKSIPAIYMENNWVKGSGEISDFVKIKPAVRNACKFETLNLLDFSKEIGNREFELIFCRNVFIYFKPEQIKSITEDLLKHLTSDGLFFIGISESLNGIPLPVTYVAPSIYVPKNVEKSKVHPARPTASLSTAKLLKGVTGETVNPVVHQPVNHGVPTPIKVFCVDDSETILNILKHILTRESGFDVVGTAMNGNEASEQIRKTKPDIVTLDIHMPVQTGIEYLEKNFSSTHPPVLMLTTVSREDAELGLRSLELGAIDYIEKPSLSDMTTRADEIRMKLRCAVLAKASQARKGVFEIERAFQKTHVITKPESKVRIIVAGLADRDKLSKVLSELTGTQAPTLVFFEGADVLLAGMEKFFKKAKISNVSILSKTSQVLSPSQIYIADFKQFSDFKVMHMDKRCSLIVFADVSNRAIPGVLSWPRAGIITEDLNAVLSDSHKSLLNAAKWVVPHSSFIYHSNEYLAADGGHE